MTENNRLEQIQGAVQQHTAHQAHLQEVNASVAMLRTEADKVSNLIGFGRRILVPPDEIHVVVGDGAHSWALSNERKVFGQSADRPARYWLNSLTQVIKLKTISFTVPIRGVSDSGVPALDSSKVSFQLWAHAVAKLNPDKAETAAQRVGLDTTGLINTITEVGTAELVAAAATMGLDGIIADRQKLAEIAFPKVNQILAELGYDLALLTITKLDGLAYVKLVEQAESRISKETSIATNTEQVAELKDDQAREQLEAEIRALTEKKLAAERLGAQQEVETATISQQEALDIRRHQMELKQVERSKAAAGISHDAEFAKVELAQKLAEAETEKAAHLARITAEREAELDGLQKQKAAQIRIAETEAEANRLAMEQLRSIERKAQLTQAEADRLRAQELAQAHRAREIALISVEQKAEGLKIDADANARALQMKTDAETKAELVKAEAEAVATEKRAHAATLRAEATRAEAAAPGLAEAEVEGARVKVAQQQVAVTRAEGIARAEIKAAEAEAEANRVRQLREIDINAQKELAELYNTAPTLVEIEKMKLQLDHERALTEIRMDAQVKAFSAIAPGIKIHIYGNGGQTGEIINNILAASHGFTHLGEHIPQLGYMFGNETSKDMQSGASLMQLKDKLSLFMPYVQQVVSDINPRVLSSLKLSELVNKIEPLIAGEQNLVGTLNDLKNDAAFRMIGDIPVQTMLQAIGLSVPDGAPKLVADDIAG